MSTIAFPRETPALGRRASSNPLGTPSSSTRPSLDGSCSVSVTGSPSRLASAVSAPAGGSGGGRDGKRTNRAALRKYYNLRKAGPGTPPPLVEGAVDGTQPPLLLLQPLVEGAGPLSPEVQTSEMDAIGFDAAQFVARTLAESGLNDLLRVYARVLAEVRALDAEKKALVYDNYSKLISATETIRKMMTNMGPLNPLTSTLDPAITRVYAQAVAIRDALREDVPPPMRDASDEDDSGVHRQRRDDTRRLARVVVQMPERLRALVRDGKMVEAREAWDRPRRLLELWRDQGLGGDDVAAVMAEGDAALLADSQPRVSAA